MKISIHDNFVSRYEIDFSQKTLSIFTKYLPHSCSEVNEFTDIIFEGYLAHRFEYEGKDAILYSVEECSLEEFIKSNIHEIEKGKKHGWPTRKQWASTAQLIQILREDNYKAFHIIPSLGLEGFVISKDMKMISRIK